MAEATQVLYHLLQGTVVGTHAHAPVALAPARRLVTHDAQQFVFRRQRQAEASGEALHFGRQFERMRHQHQRRRMRRLAHGNFLEQTHQPRIVLEKRMQVAHHVQVRLRIGLDHAQRRFRLHGRRLIDRRAAEAQALQALGHRPGVQAEATPDRQASQGFQHAQLVPGLDHHQLDLGIQHQPKIMNIVLQHLLLVKFRQPDKQGYHPRFRRIGARSMDHLNTQIVAVGLASCKC